MQFIEAKEYILDLLEKRLPSNLYYHGIHHTLDVLRAVEENADTAKLSSYNKQLLFTATIYHDSGFLKQYKSNEAASVKICSEILPGFGFSHQEIELISRIIMSTTIPQSPFDSMSEILCDADLDYLGRDDFFIVGWNLRREWKEYGNILSITDWYKQQVDFLGKHKYYTASARELREEKKRRHLAYLKELLIKT